MKGNLPTLGIYTPLPGSASGIADYAARTAATIADLFQISFVGLDNYRPPDTFDHVLYHVGIGRHSVAAFRAAAIRPGPIILHEYVLSQFFIENHDILDGETNAHVRKAFEAALCRPFPTSVELDALMRSERQRELHLLDLGLERLVVERATAVLVHSAAATSKLRNRYGVIVQPLEFPVPPLPTSAWADVRRAWRIPESVKLFGSFGFVGTHKRLSLLLRTWAELEIDPSVAQLLVAGQGTTTLRPWAGRAAVIEYVPSPNDFASLVAAVDVGVQLRHPTLGETSGVVAQLLAAKIPVIVSTHSIVPRWAESELVCVVDPDGQEETQLRHAIARAVYHRPVSRGSLMNLQTTCWKDTILHAVLGQ